MHHLKNKNTKTILYILSVYSCSSDMYAHTRARNECVCVTLTNQRCLLRTCSLSIRTFVHSKASKDFRKDSKASAGSTPKRSDLFQALERSSKFIKAIRSRRMKYESFCWTSTLNQDFQDLPGPQRSFAAKVPSNFSSGWFKELVRINVCSTRSSSSSLALGHQAVSGRLIDCDCLRLCNLPPPPSPCQPQRLYLAALPSKTCGEPTSVDSICKDNRNCCTGRTAWISNF
jgi:hypothetical protein